MESKINSASNQGGIFIQFLCYFYDGFLLLTLMLMFFFPTAAVPELRFPPPPPLVVFHYNMKLFACRVP